MLGAAAESLSFWLRPDFWRGPCRRQNSNAATAAAADATAAATAAAAEQSSNEGLDGLDSNTFLTVCSPEGTEVFIYIFSLFTFAFLCIQIETSWKKVLLGDLLLQSRSVMSKTDALIYLKKVRWNPETPLQKKTQFVARHCAF